MPYISRDYLNHISAEKRNQLLRTHVPLGYHPDTDDTLFVNDTERASGMYILGKPGNGKSGFMENLIRFDIEVGNAVIVMDPHGDLTNNCLATLSAHKLKNTYVLDMEDETYPFGVNLFDTGRIDTSLAQSQAINRVMHIFEMLWEDVLKQQHLPLYVHSIAVVFLANPGSTLVDMMTFLVDEDLRHRMLKNVSDPTVKQFWQSQFDDLSSAAERNRRVQPLINRLGALFIGRSLVRNILGQREKTINFRQAIENKDILFIKLPLKIAKEEARLIGTIIVSQIYATVFSFQNIPESQRPGVSLYVDEFSHFTTSDFSELLNEGRKFGSKLTIAHQYRGQLPKFLQESTVAARTIVCFQTTPEDGRELSHFFPGEADIIQPEDMNAHPVEHLLTYGSNNEFAQVLIDQYVRPMQSHKRGNRVEIKDVGIDVVDMFSATGAQKPRIADPTPYLDHLLYQVMRTGDFNAAIPPEIAAGFANCGRGFFPIVRGMFHDNYLLSPAVVFPPALVVMDVDGGLRWTRKVESSMEQLYHFLFHLRMTMIHLSEEPIGKKTSASSTVVGQMLTHLPRRAAFVRAGEDVGVIYTNDTPKPVSAAELKQRQQLVQAQTRAKYCHPRSEVEQSIMQPNIYKQQGSDAPSTNDVHNEDTLPSNEATPSRWEEAE